MLLRCAYISLFSMLFCFGSFWDQLLTWILLQWTFSLEIQPVCLALPLQLLCSYRVEYFHPDALTVPPGRWN